MIDFATPLAAVLTAFGQTVRYRPRRGADFSCTFAPTSTGSRMIDDSGPGYVVPEQVWESTVASFGNITPAPGDAVVFDPSGTPVVRHVKSVERVNDGLVYRFMLGETR